MRKKKNENQGWRKIGGKEIYARSRWESNYARYLQWQKEQGYIDDWDHEPQTFWYTNIKRGVRSYLPDFKVIGLELDHYWVEVKGWMDAKSQTKIKRFRLYYPDEKLIIIDEMWFRKNNGKMKLLIPHWETDFNKESSIMAQPPKSAPPKGKPPQGQPPKK